MCVCTGVFQDMQHRGLRVEGVGRGEESGQGVRTYLSYLCSCEAALHMRLHLFMCDYVHRCAVCNVFVCLCAGVSMSDATEGFKQPHKPLVLNSGDENGTNIVMRQTLLNFIFFITVVQFACLSFLQSPRRILQYRF